VHGYPAPLDLQATLKTGILPGRFIVLSAKSECLAKIISLGERHLPKAVKK
jgi:hypothetical protein